MGYVDNLDVPFLMIQESRRRSQKLTSGQRKDGSQDVHMLQKKKKRTIGQDHCLPVMAEKTMKKLPKDYNNHTS